MYQLIKNAKLPKQPKRSLGVLSSIPQRAEAIKNNETFYFTGKECIHGHIAKRYTNNGTCYECYRAIQKKSYHKHYHERNFNITEAEYNAMLERQYGVCAICKEEEKVIDGQTKTIKPLSIDHCHDTGKIRGLLCTTCNLGIGYFKHQSYLLRIAAIYCEET